MNRGDWRQARDYPGSLRSGDYGRGQGRAPYAGSGRAGRSGMGYGGAYGGGYAGSRQRGGRDYDPFEDMSSEPGFGAGSGGGRRMGGEGYGYGGPHEWGGPGHGDERGFWDKATDEVSSWFGDEDAERRREDDRRHSGRGPRNYARSDARINEDVCDRLTDHPGIDASDVEVSVSGREVTLSGVVQSRREKRDAEDVAESVSGVTHVQNNLRVRQAGSSVQATLDSFANAASGAFGERGGTTMSSRSGAGAASADATPSDSPSKTTTGSSPGVMRPDPGPSTAKGG